MGDLLPLGHIRPAERLYRAPDSPDGASSCGYDAGTGERKWAAMGTRHAQYWLLAALLALTLTGCGRQAGNMAATASSAPTTTAAESVATNVTLSVANRPFQLHRPAGYRDGTAAPLVIMLHGYTADGAKEEAYLKLTAESDRRGFLYTYPDSTKDRAGNTFWNATDACCNFYGSTVDDSGYVSGIINAVKARYTVDAKRVYLVGHSNGGFLSYRVACDHADQVTAIVSLAGAMWTDASRCQPTRPVSVLEIHGTADQTILFDGGTIAGHTYPSVAATVADWRRLDGCTDAASPNPPAAQDLVVGVPGPETTAVVYSTGCRAGSRVELWTMDGAVHVPAFTAAFAPAIIDFLYTQVAP
jgi:polyhydroxybutyrate depolymerase